MKIEVIAKKNDSYQFSNIILRNYLFFFIRIFKENWKIFQNRLLFPLWTYFFEKRFRFCFLPRMVCTIHTRQLYARILYTQEAQHSPRGRRQPSRCQKPAAPQLFSIRFIFSLFFLSALFFLSLSLSISIQRRGHLKTGIRK